MWENRSLWIFCFDLESALGDGVLRAFFIPKAAQAHEHGRSRFHRSMAQGKPWPKPWQPGTRGSCFWAPTLGRRWLGQLGRWANKTQTTTNSDTFVFNSHTQTRPSPVLRSVYELRETIGDRKWVLSTLACPGRRLFAAFHCNFSWLCFPSDALSYNT